MAVPAWAAESSVLVSTVAELPAACNTDCKYPPMAYESTDTWSIDNSNCDNSTGNSTGNSTRTWDNWVSKASKRLAMACASTDKSSFGSWSVVVAESESPLQPVDYKAYSSLAKAHESTDKSSFDSLLSVAAEWSQPVGYTACSSPAMARESTYSSTYCS